MQVNMGLLYLFSYTSPLIGVNFPCLSIILVERKQGHTDLVLQIFFSDIPQPELRMKCGTCAITQDDGMCHETNLLHSWGLSHTYKVLWKTLGMTGYGWKGCKCCLIWIAFLSTEYEQITIISVLSKCRKSKTVFPHFVTLLGKLQRSGNCIPSPAKTD